MKKAIFVLIVMVVLVGCGRDDSLGQLEEPSGKLPEGYTMDDLTVFGIVGDIVEIEEVDDISIIHVEGEVSERSTYDKAKVRIVKETQVYIAGEVMAPSSLEIGMEVEVIFDGPVMESYPVQGTAKSVSEAKKY